MNRYSKFSKYVSAELLADGTKDEMFALFEKNLPATGYRIVMWEKDKGATGFRNSSQAA